MRTDAISTQRYASRAELVYNTFFSALRANGKGYSYLYIQYKYNMLDTIPYNCFFALRADEKGVFICIYRVNEQGELGGERSVLL